MAKLTAVCLSLIGLPLLAHGKISDHLKPRPPLDCASAYQQNLYTEALDLCQKEANAGDPSAHAMLGLLNHRGLGIAKNDREAYEHFQFAAQRGNVVAQFHLGKLIATNTLNEPDEKQAFQWFEKAAQQQYAPGEFMLAICYRLGLGVNANLNESEYWYNQAKSHGIGSATQAPLSLLKTHPTAPNADPHQDFMLGKAYLTGEGQQQDDALALSYFQAAAQQHHPDAQAYLAWMLTLGLGGQNDLPRAIYWFKAANKLQLSQVQPKQYSLAGLSKRATPTLPQDQYTLGRKTVEGALNEREEERGLALLHMAAEERHAGAQYYLSKLYEQGKHVPQNMALAFDYAEKAALGGDADAQYALGWYYAHGIGIERNLAKADYWFDKAYVKGHHQAKASQHYVHHQIAMQAVTETPVISKPTRQEKSEKAARKNVKLKELAAFYHQKVEDAKTKNQQRRERSVLVAEQRKAAKTERAKKGAPSENTTPVAKTENTKNASHSALAIVTAKLKHLASVSEDKILQLFKLPPKAAPVAPPTETAQVAPETSEGSVTPTAAEAPQASMAPVAPKTTEASVRPLSIEQTDQIAANAKPEKFLVDMERLNQAKKSVPKGSPITALKGGVKRLSRLYNQQVAKATGKGRNKENG